MKRIEAAIGVVCIVALVWIIFCLAKVDEINSIREVTR